METIDFSSLCVKEGDLILDIGCGEGRHSIASHYHFPRARTIALDLDYTDIKTAYHRHKDFCIGENTNYYYLQADAFQLPFPDNCIDHIICSEVLEHIEDYQQVIVEMKRLLKPGASLSISVPRAWPEKICWQLSSDYHRIKGGHVRIFDKVALKKMFEGLNFYFLFEHGAHALHSPYWWLRCLFWKTQEDNKLVRSYHKLLVWDLVKKPKITRAIEKLLNPLLGKSVVLYFLNENKA